MSTGELYNILKEIEQNAEAADSESLVQALVKRLMENPNAD